MLEIVQYNGDRKVLVSFMEQLQDFLVDIDPLKRLQRPAAYGEVYVSELLNRIQKNEGMIYVATIDDIPVGMIAGIITKQTEVEKVESVASIVGSIIELVVSEEYRGRQIGASLMNTIEEYFRLKGCDTAWVDVFVANTNAHNFYKKSQYQDRMMGMIKKLG